MAYTVKDPCPPQCFMCLSWRYEEGEEEKVSLLTHTAARGMGKKYYISAHCPTNVDLPHMWGFWLK